MKKLSDYRNTYTFVKFLGTCFLLFTVVILAIESISAVILGTIPSKDLITPTFLIIVLLSSALIAKLNQNRIHLTVLHLYNVDLDDQGAVKEKIDEVETLKTIEAE